MAFHLDLAATTASTQPIRARSRIAVLLGLGLLVSSMGCTAGAARLPGFRSPSGNISCLYVPGPPGIVLCSLVHADYAATLQKRCLGPAGGGLDWHGFTLGATRKGMVSCSGGILYNPTTQRPTYVTLPYGKTWRQGVFTCSSQVTGVMCRNETGNGLSVSRQAWRAW